MRPDRPGSPGQQLPVLVIEDESLISDYVEDVLEGTRFDVVGVATTVREAISLAGQTHARLAIVDLRLDEGGSGAEAARTLRERHGMAILIITGSSKPITTGDDLAKAILRKPFLPQQLLNLLEKVAAEPWR